MAEPTWYSQIKWSKPLRVAKINEDRNVIPDFPGCYVFTTYESKLRTGTVLYIGKAKSLRTRLKSYLVDFKANDKKHEPHKGKGFVLEARNDYTDYGVFIRWVEYGGDLAILEASLMSYLDPQANHRREDWIYPLLADDERLDPRFIR